MTYTAPTPEEIAARRAQLAPFDGWNERAFCQIVAWMGIPHSYLDLGSGTGAMVNMARKIGIEAYGVDLINGPEHWFIRHDLTTPFDHWPNPRFGLVTCLEVAEHLPEDAASVLCDTIARHLAPGGKLIFSAAMPGQRGEHHVNCQPASFWRSLLHERQVSYRADYTLQLAHLLAFTSGPASAWLTSNLQVFDTWDGDPRQEIG